MKRKLLLAILCSMLFAIANAQTAQILFINNNTGSGAAHLDLKVVTKGNSTVYVSSLNVAYLGATQKLTVPANEILTLNFYVAGTNTLYYTSDNEVYSTGKLTYLFLFGNSSLKQFSASSASTASSSNSLVKFDFIQSNSSMQEIDLMTRGSNFVMANDFSYGTKTFTFNNEIAASTTTLDILPFNSDNGLYAYVLPGSTLAGQYIYLFTAGNANDMYMVQGTGVVTKLATTAAKISNGIEETNNFFNVYPNPISSILNISNNPLSGESLTISIKDIGGREILSQSFQNTIDLSDLSNGIYTLQIAGNNNVYYQKQLVKID